MSVSIGVITATAMFLAIGGETEHGIWETQMGDSETMQRLMPKVPAWARRDSEEDLEQQHDSQTDLHEPQWVTHDQPTPHRDSVWWMKLQL